MKTNREYYDLVDKYNETEGSRTHQSQRGDKYRDLLKEALSKLDEYSQNRYDKEVSNFEKEVNEWFDAYEYNEDGLMSFVHAKEMNEIARDCSKDNLVKRIKEAALDGKFQIEVYDEDWYGYLKRYEDELKSYGYKIEYFGNEDGDYRVYITWKNL